MRIRGARVLVTGAGSGIGRATALRCAREGASIVSVDIDELSARATAEACGERAVAYRCDVADYDAVASLAETVERAQGAVDVIVNNAGVGVAGPFLDNTIDDWRWLRSINLDGVAHGCHVFGARMVARGSGHVVNIASMAGYMPHATLPAYCATKSAVIMLSQCLRADWARAGVGVSAICPGVIDTPIPQNTRMVGGMVQRRDRAIKAFRFGHSPDIVARAIVGAVEHNREVVPVGVESGVAYRLLRFAPAPVRGVLARLQAP